MDKDPTTHCEFLGCGHWTNKRKPFCTDHVLMHEYALRVEKEWEARLAEKDRLKEGGDVKADCHYFREILLHISLYGPTTIKRLAIELNLDPISMGRVCTVLVDEKKAEYYNDKRGRLFMKNLSEQFCILCGSNDYCKEKDSDDQAPEPRDGCPYWELKNGFIQKRDTA